MAKKSNTPEKKREWADVNEDVKFVCQGGKVQCPFASPPIAEILPTANSVMLQDKPFATTGDDNGKVNFNFMGVCTHPSQQKPFSPPPPCKAVISLGKWKNYSNTMINNDNALLVKSTIPCMISGQDIKIIHSGQKAELVEVKPKMKREPRVTDAYWVDENNGGKMREVHPGREVTLILKTEDFEQGEMATVKIRAENGRKFKGGATETTSSGVVGVDGKVIIEKFTLTYE